MSSHGFVGDLLIRKGLVDAAGLARAVEAQAAQPSTLGRALARLGLADESMVAVETACALHLAFLEYVDDQPPQVSEKAAAALPAEFCRKRGVLPLAIEENVLKDGKIDAKEAKWLEDMLFADGKIDADEKQFLTRIKKGAKKTSPEFDALYDKCMKTK